MSFWYRISQPKLKWQTLTRQFQRCYFQIPHAHSVNNTPHKIIRGFENPYWVNGGKPSDFGYDIRFFATRAKRKYPMKPKPKPEEQKEPSGPRMNDQISSATVRLVTDDGHEVISRMEALERARKIQLDLVEVQPNADPPVCKIMDFHKEKYKRKIQEKDRVKSKLEETLRKGEKEVRFSGKIEAKDLKMKADLVKKLMDRGYRVKCVAQGTADKDLGELLSRLSSLIEDVAVVESGPRVEKSQAFIIVRHIKFGASKKGSGKKASKVVGVTSSEDDTMSPTESPEELEEESDLAETDVDSKDEVLSNEDDFMRMDDENKATWSVFDANDDCDKVFDILDGAKSPRIQTNAKLETASSVENTNVSNFPRPILDSTRKNSVPSTPVEPPPPPETQNRYKKSEPRHKFIPTTPMDDRGRGGTNPLRSAPQFLNQGNQTPSHMNSSPSTREAKQDRTDASAFRNSKLPLDEIPKHERSRPGPPCSQQPSYGGFSAPKAEAPGKLNPGPPSPQQPSYGSFSAPKAEAPGKLHPGPPSPQQPSYGAFSAPKAEAPGKFDPGPLSRQQPSYGAFSAPKAEAPGKLDPSLNSAKSEPRLPNQGKPSLPDLPSRGGIKQVPSDASVPRNSRPPTNAGPKPEQSRPVPPSSPTSSFGIFSSSTATAPGKQGTASEINRNKEGRPFESARNPTAGGGALNMNSPSKSDGSHREGGNQGGQGRWGIFSTEGSKAIPSRTSDSEAKAQR